MDAKMIIGFAALALILVSGAVAYSTGYGEGRERALRDNAAQASNTDLSEGR